MGLMRALKYTAKGYLAGRVDMMTEESKRKREDAIRKAEEEFELQKLNDKYKLETTLRTDMENLKHTNKTKGDLEKEAKELKERREDLIAQGYTKPMLDILELQGHLKSDSNWGVFFNKYNNEMQNKGYGVDWHMEFFTDPETKEETTFQEAYINQWQEYILGKGTNGFSMKDSINDSLNTKNDVPVNTADTLTTSNEDIEAKTSGQTTDSMYKEGQIPGPIRGVIETKPPVDTQFAEEVVGEKELITNNHYLSGFNKAALVPIIHIFDKHDENWALTDMNPGALQEGQMLTLTLNSNGTGYTTKFTKVSDTFEEVRQGVTDRDKELNTAIYNNKGLFSEIEDLNVFVQGGGNVSDFFAKNAANQKLYVQLFSYATLLDRSFESEKIPLSAQQIAQRAVRLVGKTNDTAANQWAALVQEQEPNSDAFFNKALETVNYAEHAIRYATQGLDKETEEGRMLISRIQDKVFTNFKHRFAVNFLDEAEKGATQAVNPKYQHALRLFNEIINDKQKDTAGNKGKFWETREEIYKETQPAREAAKTMAPEIGKMKPEDEKALMERLEADLDPTKARGIAVPLEKLRGTPTVTAAVEKDIVPTEKEGVTNYSEIITSLEPKGDSIPIKFDRGSETRTDEGMVITLPDGSEQLFKVGESFINGNKYEGGRLWTVVEGTGGIIRFDKTDPGKTQKANPKYIKVQQLKKLVKKLNEKEKATSKKGAASREIEIPKLKTQIDELIAEIKEMG